MDARVMAIGDTHLGRVLYGYDLTAPIMRAMYAFHEMCVARRVDLAVHLGDVFDRPTPTEYHRKVFAQWCNLFERSGIALRVMVGNHDAMSRAGAASALEAFKVAPWEVVEMIDRPTVEGPLFFIPWPSSAIYDDREDWLQDVLTEQAKLKPGSVVFAHLTPPGAVIGDQEWLYRGGEHVVPGPLLEDEHISLIVAGHVHRPQEVTEGVWTAGSAIRLRFDEARQHRYFVEVEDRLRLVRHDHATTLRELPIDVSAWGTGGDPPTTEEVKAELPAVDGEIVKVVPYVDDASSVDWPEVEAALYRRGAAHVHTATPIPVKRKRSTERTKALSPTDMDGAARAFITERIADKRERRAVMRLFKQLRKQVQEEADA